MLIQINCNKSVGPDSLCGGILIEVVVVVVVSSNNSNSIFALPLIINRSLTNCEFPEDWKMAFFKPNLKM